jgi:hypothetical protein
MAARIPSAVMVISLDAQITGFLSWIAPSRMDSTGGDDEVQIEAESLMPWP